MDNEMIKAIEQATLRARAKDPDATVREVLDELEDYPVSDAERRAWDYLLEEYPLYDERHDAVYPIWESVVRRA